jgi:hypothetical protein
MNIHVMASDVANAIATRFDGKVSTEDVMSVSIANVSYNYINVYDYEWDGRRHRRVYDDGFLYLIRNIGYALVKQIEKVTFRVLCSTEKDIYLVNAMLEIDPSRVEVVLTKRFKTRLYQSQSIGMYNIKDLNFNSSHLDDLIKLDHFHLRNFNEMVKKSIAFRIRPEHIPGFSEKIHLMCLVWGDRTLDMKPVTNAVAISSRKEGSDKYNDAKFIRSLSLKRGIEFYNCEI